MNELKKYTRDDVYKITLEYFKGDTLATDVWINKYCLKDNNNNYYETSPDNMHRRIAKEFARIELKYVNPMSEEEIYETLKNFTYIVPQGSPMSGIGNDFQIVSISNCFVVGNTDEDSYGSILKTDQDIVQLSKRRAGVGTTLEHVRPMGSPVKNAAMTSTGVVPFMERYSNSIREVAQSGRRGALLLATHIKSMDSEDFINAKLDTTKVTGANISIKIDDDFMECLENDKLYKQQFPIYAKNPEQSKEVNPKKIWDKLIYNNWKSAEPGIFFWDTVIRESIPDCYADFGFKSIATNPCGEIILCDKDSCRLLLLNVYSYVENPFTSDAKFNYTLFEKHVQIAERYMDDIVDLELEKIDKILDKIESDPESEETKLAEKNLWLGIKDKCIKGRRTGLGLTGMGDMLAALGLIYGTEEATTFSTDIQKIITINAFKSSIIMAKERGAFPIFDMSLEYKSDFIKRLYNEAPELEEMTKLYGRRNIALLTLAPAGTTSIMTQTTSGIEPVFLPYYKRRKKINPSDKNAKVSFVDGVGDKWSEYFVFHHKFLYWAKINNYDNITNLEENELNDIFEKSPYYKATSNDVNWREGVQMQGNIQKWIDHSISKTINLPSDTTVDVVDELYRFAHKVGCKGITIYRDGSRDGVLISSKETKKEETKQTIKELNAQKRTKVLDCDVVRFSNNNEKWIACVGLMKDDDNTLYPYEIFTGNLEDFFIPNYVTKGVITKVREEDVDLDGNKIIKKRYDFSYTDKHGYKVNMEGISRSFKEEYWNYAKFISALLRNRMRIVDINNLIDSLKFDTDLINTWKKGIQRALKGYIKDDVIEGSEKSLGTLCKECGSLSVVKENGCEICKNCGAGKCN